MYDAAERSKRAAKQTSLDLTSEKIPELNNILPGVDNNLADWIFTIDKRWRLCCRYDKY